ncbi:hypothetical protein [Verrucosispora sp. NA02020]|uniref:hypothetical protein n=1 Tax=Verrucosispora sp. NA02020 TaxID=2742132 RepID=UPI003D71B05E
MTYRTPLAAAALVCLALAGCGGDSEPSATPPSSSPPPVATSAVPTAAPITDDKSIREVCNTVAELGNDNDFNPVANLAAGKLAALIADPAFARAGDALVDAAGAAVDEPGPDTNIAIARAQLDVAGACIDKYGDGPW